MPCETMSGARNFVAPIDDFSGLSMVCALKTKADAADAVKTMITKMETVTSRKLKAFRSDNEPVFLSNDFTKWLSDRGCAFDTSPPYSPESNGKAERVQRTLFKTMR